MYVYFDEQGILKEIISEPIRRGSADYNSILVYVEGLERGDYWAIFERADSELTPEREYTETVVAEIPYDPKRDLGYFKYFKEYTFHKIDVDPEVLQVAGTALCTVRINVDGALFALGRITFNVEDNAIKEDHGITQSQYDYLIERGAATYFYPNVDTESGTLYWTNNAGLDNPPPVHLAGLGPESVSTSDIADGAVTPEKLDREYLPLAGGVMEGTVDTSYPFIERGHFEITQTGDMAVAGSATFSGNSLFTGGFIVTGADTAKFYIPVELRSTVTLGGQVLTLNDNTLNFDNSNTVFNKVVTFAGTTAISDLRANKITSNSTFTVDAIGAVYSFDGQDGSGAVVIKPYLASQLDEEAARADEAYVHRVNPPSAGDWAYTKNYATGNDGLIRITDAGTPSEGQIPRYATGGRLAVGNPSGSSDAANKKYVDDQIARVRNGVVQVVDQLPDAGEEGVFYYVPSGDGYEQWIYKDGQWVDIGKIQIDLSDYYNKAETDAKLDTKLTKVDTGPAIYAVNARGNQWMVPVNDKPAAGNVPLWGRNGQLLVNVGDASHSKAAVNKNYLNEKLAAKVSFLKLDDDGILPQSIIPRYTLETSIPKDSTTLKAQFGTGSYNLVNGLVLDCFLRIGSASDNTLCVGKFNGDGENNLYITDITPLENGAMVSMREDDQAHYKNYQVLTNKDSSSQPKIWEMLYPMNCRFNLEAAFPGDTYFSEMSNADIKIKMTSDGAARLALHIRNITNSSISLDTSDYHPTTDSAGENFQVLLIKKNYGAIMGLNMVINNEQNSGGAVQRLMIQDALNSAWSGNIYPRLTYYSPLNLTTISGEPATNYWFVALDKATYDAAGVTKAVRMDYRFEFSSSGSTTVEPIPNIVDYTPTAEPTKAMAMSVMSLQEPIKPNIPEKAVGIFSVDEQGNTIDAMTGEVVQW